MKNVFGQTMGKFVSISLFSQYILFHYNALDCMYKCGQSIYPLASPVYAPSV